MTRTIGREELRRIAWGACFLGSGGGGSLLAAEGAITASFESGPDKRIEVATVEEAVVSGDLAVVVAFGGAPSKSQNRSEFSVHPLISAVQALDLHCQKVMRKRIGYLLPVEVGAINTVAACLAALELNKPVIDADGAGRSVPLLTMTTFGDMPPSPMSLSNGSDETITLYIDDMSSFQHLFRGVVGTAAFGGFAGLALCPMSKDALEAATPIRGTLGLAEEIGKTLSSGESDPVGRVIAMLNGRGVAAQRLFSGKLEHEQLASQGGQDFLQAVLRREDDGDEVRIYILNENLVAWNSAHTRPLAMAPDLLSFVEVATGRPLSNAREDASSKSPKVKRRPMVPFNPRRGPFIDFTDDLDEVALIGVAAHPRLRDTKRIQEETRKVLVHLGYPGVYQPIEAIGTA